MNSKNPAVYELKVVDTGKVYIGTVNEIADHAYLSKSHVAALVKNDNRKYKSRKIGNQYTIYKVSWRGKIYQGTIDELTEELGMAKNTIKTLFARQNKGVYTTIKCLGQTKEIR